MDAAKYRPEEPGREQCCVCWWMPLAVRYGKIARIADPPPDTKLLLRKDLSKEYLGHPQCRLQLRRLATHRQTRVGPRPCRERFDRALACSFASRDR